MKDEITKSIKYYKSFTALVLIIFTCITTYAQDKKLYVKLGSFNSVNENTVTIMGCGTNNELEYIYFSSPWLCEREVKIPSEYLSQAKNSINFVRTKYREWCNSIRGKGFKGKHKAFSTEHTIYTRQSYIYDWHPKSEKMYYVFFVNLASIPLIEAKISLGGTSAFCFYLTETGIDQFCTIINNAKSIYLKSRDVEFDNLLK